MRRRPGVSRVGQRLDERQRSERARTHASGLHGDADRRPRSLELDEAVAFCSRGAGQETVFFQILLNPKFLIGGVVYTKTL